MATQSKKGYMSPSQLASWVKKTFKSKLDYIVSKNVDLWMSSVLSGAQKEVNTANILKLQVNGFTMAV